MLFMYIIRAIYSHQEKIKGSKKNIINNNVIILEKSVILLFFIFSFANNSIINKFIIKGL